MSELARPLDERDRSVPIRCLGFGWLWFQVPHFGVYAPAVTMVKPRSDNGRQVPTSSLITVLGVEGQYAVPGSPGQVIDAIVDALGGAAFQPMHPAPVGAISHARKP